MTVPESSALQRVGKIAAWLFIWAFIAWLIYPLIFLEAPTLQEASKYFYRSALGIILLIILFGKTLTDIFFPLDTSRKKAVLQVIFLMVYALLMAGGIIFVLMRIFLLYLKGGSAGQAF